MNNKILLVEDSRAFRNYLVQKLMPLGCEIITAETLSETQDILTQHDDFLCTVLDYCLPDAPNGEVIDLVLSHQHKVIVLTAAFSDDTREHFISKGVVDYILKEGTGAISYLLPLINRLLNNLSHQALVVDDSVTIRKYVSQLLEHQYIQTLQAENGEQALTILEQNPQLSFIITDHDMPEKDGISMIKDIRKTCSKNEVAILGLSGSDEPTMTARFLKAGANDFLKKPFNQEEFYCRVHQMLDMQEATKELFQMANQDALTKLWNRRYFFSQAENHTQTPNIAMLDIDFFKQVNDTYGHDGGDAVLVTVARILQIYFKDDVVARFGGEEFCIQHFGHFQDFTTRLEHLRQRVAKTGIHYLDQQIYVSISIGATDMEGSLDQQIKEADDKLYQAKQSGRNRLIA